MFVVDAAHPSGEPLVEGSDYTRYGERWVFKNWRLRGEDDETPVIALAAPSLPVTSELKDLLGEAMDLPLVRIQGARLSPSSGRRP
ncbi:hypothetical protein BON30_48865 [Cystobacter ferrugineus]|uniref:Uncharacterized protein n=1 Tax=Cystobacter ferrugineus TaxID=83449 RepID=A0A1L9ATV4_9BACT|nr:hypothetical protein BON30_48865 [Cystobacter ferrugineus]